MNNIDWFNTEFVKRYGSVKRARGCYWYTEKGVRLVDLWQEDGRAILGWGACNSKAFEVLKNTISRGQTGSFPTDYSKRFSKAVLQLVNTNCTNEILASNYQYVSLTTDYSSLKDLPVWRPWLGVSVHDCSNLSAFNMIALTNASEIVVQIPFAWTENVYVIASVKKIERDSFPVSGAYLAAATRAIYSLIAEQKKRKENDFKRFDSSLKKYFSRKGPYLVPCIKEYKDFVLHCLDCGIVINPNKSNFSIVPFGANPGDFRKLDKTPFCK
ncbi:MAG: hypothetical protein BKP49_04140 [Treponema sp. CETP13]|nr:MAG: hypothetical protein BKP49_04140 [Treponema sp. CETP13]